MPATVLGSGYPTVNETQDCPHGTYILVGGRHNKDTDKVAKSALKKKLREKGHFRTKCENGCEEGGVVFYVGCKGRPL